MAASAKQAAAPGRKSAAGTAPELSLQCKDQKAWAAWLKEHHAASTGVWLRIARKGAAAPSVSYAEALEAALCHGWIDGQKKSGIEGYWLQRFTPRSAKSIWSKINRDKALRLIAEKKMQAAGLREVEHAKADGRWEGAYDSQSKAVVPADLQAALDAAPKVKEFFATLDSANRYAVLFRIQAVKKEETRARKIKQFVEMLARHEKIHP